MSNEGWSQVKQHFLHLADKSPVQRSEYLDLVFEDDDALRADVESLLEAHDDLDTITTRSTGVDTTSIDAIESVGAYAVLGRLGRGGAADVFQAQHPVFGDVALKLISASSLVDDTTRARFEQEANVLKTLRHPALCVVHDVFVTSTFAGLAMARVDGVSLDQRLHDGPLTYGKSLTIIRTLLDALSVAHAAGVVHRDIKPANVMLSKTGKVTLIDFGIARLAGANLTMTGQMLGSPRYMSPEQWRGEKVDARSDQFSLGLLWYELLTGIPAFNASSLDRVAHQVMHEEPDALPTVSIDGRDLCKVVPVLQTLLAKPASSRYSTTDEISQVLRQLT